MKFTLALLFIAGFVACAIAAPIDNNDRNDFPEPRANQEDSEVDATDRSKSTNMIN